MVSAEELEWMFLMEFRPSIKGRGHLLPPMEWAAFTKGVTVPQQIFLAGFSTKSAGSISAVFLQILFFSLKVACCGEFIYILEILGYALLMELLKYTMTLMMIDNSSPMEEDTYNNMDENCLIKKASIPKVKSHVVWLFGQALDLTAELITDDTAENILIMATTVLKQKAPIVHSPTIWSYCIMLGIDAKLEFPTNAPILKADELPVVTSKEVYLFCQALGLRAKVAL
ncbi:hypothetical protein HNY73_001760 [Argiope bruennichi]|uniref:Uncharacterized protein n=1 Tax=Argiope bruennichi TaxID=94029 RepID=A0A8T0FTV4_ARGBR|nr:hypothetical protein HNY73_001760 [Argiope bruennichi]